MLHLYSKAIIRNILVMAFLFCLLCEYYICKWHPKASISQGHNWFRHYETRDHQRIWIYSC